MKENEMNLPEVIYWDGPGWYASVQVGSYKDTHIETKGFGDQEEQPDTYGVAGTPFWLDSRPIDDENVSVY